MKNLIYLLFFFLSISVNHTFASTGCLYLGDIYTYQQGTTSGIDPPAPYPPGSYPRYRSALFIPESSAFCVNSSSSPCRVGGNIQQWGVLVGYSITDCPIDDYIPLMLVISGSVGVLFLRERFALLT